MRPLVALLVVCLVALSALFGCGSEATPSLTFSGIVVDVAGTGPASVDRFTVRSPAGATMTFEVQRLDINRGKPAAHLREHLATGESVTVVYVVEGGRNLALSYAH